MEMDIYTRRRLAALGILGVVVLFFVLLIRSCGGDDEEPVTTVATTATDAPLSREEYIAQADAICAEVNRAIESIDPEDDDAAQQELELVESQRVRLESLVPEDTSGGLKRFLRSLDGLVDALEVKQAAVDRGDDTAIAEADTAIAEAKETGEAAAERYGFEECGRFGEPGNLDDGDTDDTVVVPTTTTPAPPATTPPPAPTEPAPAPAPAPDATAPPADSGGDTGGTGDGSSGGITP